MNRGEKTTKKIERRDVYRARGEDGEKGLLPVCKGEEERRQ